MIYKQILRFSSFTTISRVLGFARDKLLATLLGASPMADAFFIAFRFPNLFRKFFAEGAVQSALVPELTDLMLKKSKEDAFKLAQVIFTYVLLFLCAFVVLFEIFTPQILKMITSGFDAERMSYVVKWTRITFPFIFFISLSAILTSILNSYQKFSAEALAPVIMNIVFISSGVLAFKFVDSGTVLSIGLVIAGFVQFIVSYLVVRRTNFRLRLSFKWNDHVKKTFSRVGQTSIGSAVAQLNAFVDMSFASKLPASSVSYLYYADRLHQLPFAIFGVAFGIVLLPNFVKLESRKDDLLQAGILNSLALTLPSMLGIFVLSDVIVSILYLGGNFKLNDALMTSRVLGFYVMSLPAYVLTKIFLSYFYAQKKAFISMITGVVGIVANIIGNILLMKSMQCCGIAISTAISGWLVALMLFGILHKKIITRTFLGALFTLILWNALFACLLLLLRHCFSLYLQDVSLKAIASLFFVIASSALIYLGLGYKLGIILPKKYNINNLMKEVDLDKVA